MANPANNINPANRSDGYITGLVSGFPKFKIYVLLFALSFLAYANTLKNGFVGDDVSAISMNKFVQQGPSAIPELLTTRYRAGFRDKVENLYRPLSLVLFSAIYAGAGLNPWPYHLAAILIFACCVVVLFKFLDELFHRQQTPAAFFAALLFALHPIHTEVVANVKSCDESLCFLSSFAGLLLLLQYFDTGSVSKLVLGCGSLFFGLMAKESAITFAALIPVVFVFWRDGSTARKRAIVLGTGTTFAVYLLLRYMVLAKYGPGDTASANHLDNLLADPGVSMASRFATAIYMLGYGLRLLILPFPLVSDYSYNAMPVTGFTNPLVIISVLVFVAMAVFGVRRVLARRLAPSAFAAVYYLVTISVFSNLFLLIGSNFGERFLFFPSVGFCLAVGFLLAKILDGTLMGVTLTKNNGTAWAILALMVTVYGYLSVVRNADWVSNLTLAGADVAKSPNSARLNYNYGIELERSLEVGQADKARQQVVRTEALGYLEKAYALYPSFEFIHDQMGVMYRRNGQGAQAIEHLSAAIKIDARDSVATNELAEIYFNGKQYQQSIDLNRGALYLNANKAAVCTHIAAAFGLMSRYDSATAYLYKAIALNPGYNAAYGNLAFIYNAMNLPDSVQKYRQLAQTPKR